jgi:hypothetical protein
MKQTAVEWLEQEFIALQNYSVNELGLFAKAKEMEKQQIIDVWSNGYDEEDRANANPLTYYEKTYGGNNGKN